MCQSCEWETWGKQLDEILSDEQFDFASDTLSGIKDWVFEQEHITERQIEAIQNIKDSKS